MKIEYDDKKEPEKECLAYIDEDGNLIIWDCATGGGSLVAHGFVESGHVFELSKAKHKLYTGDSVKITF